MKIERIQESFEINPGAPIPTILSNEHHVYVIFYVNSQDSNSQDEIVTLKFNLFAQFKFGDPNDEAISGHPLSSLGLEPYAFHKVLDSDWIIDLRTMNAVHPYHKDERFDKYTHFILFFHDTCFEIVAEGYEIDKNVEPIMRDEILRIGKLL